MKKAYINGEFVDHTDAKVSIFDRGLLFGDSIYEVLPVYNGQAFFLDRHLARLFSNAEKIKLNLPELDWVNVIKQLIQHNGGGNLQVYIQITRGDQGTRKHDIPTCITPTIIAFTLHTPFPTLADKEKGLSAKLLDDIRWMLCDIKTTSLLGNILLNDEAVSSGFQTSILVRDNQITEGSTSNVFIVTPDGRIKTPPLNHLCLPGITRQITLELLQRLEWEIVENSFSTQELMQAQEVWITSTTKEIFPVTQIDDTLIGTGKAGSYWRQVETLYNDLIS